MRRKHKRTKADHKNVTLKWIHQKDPGNFTERCGESDRGEALDEEEDFGECGDLDQDF